MTDEGRDLRLWPNAPAGSYDDFDYAILTSYRAIGGRRPSLFYAAVPGAMNGDDPAVPAVASVPSTPRPLLAAWTASVPSMPELSNHIRAMVPHLPPINIEFSSIDWQKWFTIIVGPLLLLGIWSLFFSGSPMWSPCTVEKVGRCASFKELVEAFPSQPVHVWGAVKAANALAIMGRGPGIIMMVSNYQNKALLDDLADMSGHMVAHSISPSCRIIQVNSTWLSNYAQPQTHIHASLNKDSQFVAVIHDVHKLNAASAAVLHSFIDQVSPYRSSVFIFTLTTNEFPSETLSRKDQELLAEKVLHDAWKDDLDLNHRSPLVARMTSNTVVVWSEHGKAHLDPHVYPEESESRKPSPAVKSMFGFFA